MTRLTISYLVCAPLCFGLYLGMIPGNGGNGWVKIQFGILWALPVSLLVGSIAAVLFNWMRWRLATWISLLIPALLGGIALLMVLLGMVTNLDGA